MDITASPAILGSWLKEKENKKQVSKRNRVNVQSDANSSEWAKKVGNTEIDPSPVISREHSRLLIDEN